MNAKRTALIACVLCAGQTAWPADQSLEVLVARLDRIRIPAQSCTATIVVSRPDRPGEAAQAFKSFTRVTGSGPGQQTSALLVCTAPAKDAGKRLLFTPDSCWFHDPKAKNPVRISPGQLWSQPASADSPNWRLAPDFSATAAGREEIACEDGVKRVCTVVDFTPRSGSLAAPALMRYWVGDDGRYWRAEHYTAGRRLLKTIDNLRYAHALGAERVTAMRIRAGSETAEVAISGLASKTCPAEWFEPANLPLVQPQAGADGMP